MAETVTRMTREGRKLTYVLTVIQQPERARACGSGAKSSADRRPVDPPPVVELRIFEGDAKNDVTFSYNANFFLFATLETARPIIHGRVQQAPQQIPVLTGMPVSGMAYLDRPSEAGYFIFPDLSVRHEGKYRLSFNLYEETKDHKDHDADQSPDAATEAPNGSFDWRLEVKSAPFTVFSAKKFPGLAESTILSRTVAEQGCRVRIRRDVRMRRREGKVGTDFDEVDEANDYRRPRSSTPAVDPTREYSRQRSTSNSNGDRKPYDQHHRPPGDPYQAHQYPAPYSHAPAPAPQPPGSYLSFGANSTQQPQFQTPQFAQPAPPQVQPQQPHQSGPSPYQQTAQYGTQQSPGGYGFQERPQYAQYQGVRDYDSEYRRQSLSYAPTSQPTTNGQYPHDEQDSGPPPAPYPPYQSRTEQPVLAPINVKPSPSLESKYENMSSPIGPPSANIRVANGLTSPGYPERSNSYGSFAQPLSATEAPRAGAKRPYDAVFSGNSYNQPLHNGMRPSSSHNGPAGYLDNEDMTMDDQHKMRYKRADGTPNTRELPAFE